MTTGSIAGFIERNQNNFPLVQVNSLKSDKPFEVIGLSLLPAFEEALIKSEEAGQSVNKLHQSIEPANKKEKEQRSKDSLISLLINLQFKCK